MGPLGMSPGGIVPSRWSNAVANKMTVKHPSSVRDFAIEVSTDGIGSTIQIFYAGRPSGGMSGFGGTPKRALEDMAELLRKLAADVDAIPAHAPKNTLIVIDRETGETERIHEDDGNFRASVALAAEKIGLSFDDAMARLSAGEELATAGFLRRIETAS